MQLAVERKADLVLVQEPPALQIYTQQGYDFMCTNGRIMTAKGKGQRWSANTLGPTKNSNEDVQTLMVN